MCYTNIMSTFEHLLQNMILSASGWRGVFAKSQNEEDSTEEILDEHVYISVFAAKAFSEYMKEKTGNTCCIVVGRDSRPTGKAIADAMLKTFLAHNIDVKYVGIVAAPEVMSFAKNADGFAYISASHNPIGHNGIKFGFSDGGVMPGSEAKILIERFKNLCSIESPEKEAMRVLSLCTQNAISEVYSYENKFKTDSYNAYKDFSKLVISGEESKEKQDAFFSSITKSIQEKSLTVVCDMNGSARTKSIDKDFFTNLGIQFEDFNSNIVHAIIPEGKNLEYCAKKISELQSLGKKDALLGYMPDCDGDRGNIVFWNTQSNTADILQAQEVFTLSVLSEFTYSLYRSASDTELKLAVAVNGATSTRIEDIANAFNAQVFRAEVGEANIVNCAREKRKEGYTVPILGEGSNGGNITHPAAVRDPINTLFALIKLLTIRSTKEKKGLFEIWCEKSNQMNKYKEDFTLVEIMETLPHYVTTGVSEERALLKIKTRDHTKLKQNFQKAFIASWDKKKESLKEKYGFYSWEAAATIGTKELRGIDDFGVSGTGGLKIRFMNKEGSPIANMWMRGSGTEPVFRVMADIKNGTQTIEKEIITWETELLEIADNM